MTHKLFVAALLVSSLPLAACDRPAGDADRSAARADSADTAAVVAAVNEAEAGMLAAFQAKDAARLTAYYAPDAIVATPGRVVKGSAAIAKATAEDLADPAFALTFANEKTDVASSGDLAYTSGSFSVSYTNPGTKAVDKAGGPYVTVFRKLAVGWWEVGADVARPGAPG